MPRVVERVDDECRGLDVRKCVLRHEALPAVGGGGGGGAGAVDLEPRFGRNESPLLTHVSPKEPAARCGPRDTALRVTVAGGDTREAKRVNNNNNNNMMTKSLQHRAGHILHLGDVLIGVGVSGRPVGVGQVHEEATLRGADHAHPGRHARGDVIQVEVYGQPARAAAVYDEQIGILEPSAEQRVERGVEDLPATKVDGLGPDHHGVVNAAGKRRAVAISGRACAQVNEPTNPNKKRKWTKQERERIVWAASA